MRDIDVEDARALELTVLVYNDDPNLAGVLAWALARGTRWKAAGFSEMEGLTTAADAAVPDVVVAHAHVDEADSKREASLRFLVALRTRLGGALLLIATSDGPTPTAFAEAVDLLLPAPVDVDALRDTVATLAAQRRAP